MRKLSLILLLSAITSCMVIAQEVRMELYSVRNDTILRVETVAEGVQMPSVAVCPDESVLETIAPVQVQGPDSLHLPNLGYQGQLPFGIWSGGYAGWYNWRLHEGLNVSLGTSVFAAFGKNAPHGAGFTQSVSAMYAMPITSRLSLAVGGYFDNIYWTDRSFNSAGLNAVLGYKFDEHWEGYIYGQKSMLNKRMPYPLYDLNSLGDRIGAAVQYNFNPRFSVRVAVESVRH